MAIHGVWCMVTILADCMRVCVWFWLTLYVRCTVHMHIYICTIIMCSVGIYIYSHIYTHIFSIQCSCFVNLHFLSQLMYGFCRPLGVNACFTVQSEVVNSNYHSRLKAIGTVLPSILRSRPCNPAHCSYYDI
jgi:hypothetical protein